MQEGPLLGDDVLREGLDSYEQMVNTFADHKPRPFGSRWDRRAYR
jgi:hypothetical protein